jgi:3-oxoacyl-[acyl-carrier-protein] synthase II
MLMVEWPCKNSRRIFMERRVVVTGLGTVNPLANNVKDFWQAVKNAENGITRITRFDCSSFASQVGGEVKNFNPADYLDKKEYRKLDLFSIYAMVSSMEAMQDAGFGNGNIKPEKLGVIIGNGIGGIETLSDEFKSFYSKPEGYGKVYPLMIPKMISNIAPAHVAIKFNALGPCYSVVTACASGTDAIGNSFHLIKNGTANIMITGGTEAPLVPIAMAGFCIIQAVTRDFNDNPEKASRPFDKDRSGFVLAEGAGILILEELEHAIKRGARIYAEVAGYGISCDAYHITAPHAEGKGATIGMKNALFSAKMKPEDIDYINAHGTSTLLNDKTETKAIKAVFGEHARKLKISSTKSMTGHVIGGTGGIEAITSILAIRDQYFPATRNLDNPDPECDLDFLPNKGYEGKIDAAMSNSFGFGGHNGILIFKKYTK